MSGTKRKASSEKGLLASSVCSHPVDPASATLGIVCKGCGKWITRKKAGDKFVVDEKKSKKMAADKEKQRAKRQKTKEEKKKAPPAKRAASTKKKASTKKGSKNKKVKPSDDEETETEAETEDATEAKSDDNNMITSFIPGTGDNQVFGYYATIVQDRSGLVLEELWNKSITGEVVRWESTQIKGVQYPRRSAERIDGIWFTYNGIPITAERIRIYEPERKVKEADAFSLKVGATGSPVIKKIPEWSIDAYNDYCTDLVKDGNFQLIEPLLFVFGHFKYLTDIANKAEEADEDKRKSKSKDATTAEEKKKKADDTDEEKKEKEKVTPDQKNLYREFLRKRNKQLVDQAEKDKANAKKAAAEEKETKTADAIKNKKDTAADEGDGEVEDDEAERTQPLADKDDLPSSQDD